MTDPFAALGDANRRAIVSQLAISEQSVSELAEGLPVSRPAVSRHLRVLKDAGLVAVRSEGNKRLYRLDDAGVSEVRSFLEETWGRAIPRFKLFVENT